MIITQQENLILRDFFSWYINILGLKKARNNFTIKWQKNIEIKPGEQNLDVT